MKKFEKESLTVEEQLDLLIKRNLKVDNYKSDSSFETDIINLFNRYPSIGKELLGFPTNWNHFSVTRILKHEKNHFSNAIK